MNPIVFALRHPYTVMVAIVAIVLGSVLAFSRMKIDIFPSLNLPVIYVAQPYGGLDPAQMEGLITNYYEYHFLYISGIHHVESKNVQGNALMKLQFHPGTNMAQAMAETSSRSRRPSTCASDRDAQDRLASARPGLHRLWQLGTMAGRSALQAGRRPRCDAGRRQED